jgi:DNA-binding response OmpR family regulator
MGLVARDPLSQSAGPAVRRKPATIVVLEESAAAQELIEQALRKTGDIVLVSNNAAEILQLASRVQIDVIVGDAGLLEGTDPLVVDHLQALGPVLYTHVRGSWRRAQLSESPMLPSPFSLEELSEAVAAVLRDHR